MRFTVRLSLCLLAGASAFGSVGCNSVPGQWHRQSALVNRRLHGQNQQLAQQQSAIDQERQRLAQENADLQQRLATATSRLDNLNNERQQLQSRYTSMLKNQQNVLSDSATQKFKDLANKYPGLEFDPETGVSRLKTDLLFDSGSTHIKESAKPLIQEMASILNAGDAKQLKLLIVGHTDDRPIAKESTKKQHPTNWHLSTNRANEVVLAMHKAGISPSRMGSSGYGEFQPVAPNTNDAARARNRRVEVFVLAPDSPIALQMETSPHDPRSATKGDDWDPRMAK